MKRAMLLLCCALALLFVSCEPVDEVTEDSEWPQKFVFSVQNNRDSDVLVSVQLAEQMLLADSSEWHLFSGYADAGRKTKTVHGGKLETFSFEDYLMQHSFPRRWSFVLTVGDELYLGFPESEAQKSSLISETLVFDRAKVKGDNFHWIKLTGDTTEPTLGGSLTPAKQTGIREGRVYAYLTEHFTVTIGDEVTIALDSVEF